MRALVPVGRVVFAMVFVASIMGHFSSAEIAQASAHGVPFAHLMVPLAGVTLFMHRFWGLPDPQMAMMQRIQFMKDLSLIGGALVIMYFGAGPYSLDR